MSGPGLRSGGRILADTLARHGVDTAFGVPGESYLALLDALHDSDIRFVICRQEGGAAMMADAYGKLTGKPGICMVTRGPGATNASAGVHIAQQDSTPMILLIGQVARDQQDREAFQEIDYRRMYGQLAKWVAQIDDPARIPEYLNRAFHTATSGRPGPVVLALPEDMLREEATARDVGPWKPIRSYPAPQDMKALQEKLAAAERPMILLGGGGWDAAACRNIADFAERNHIPVSVSFRCQDLIDNRHRNYVGHVGIGINPPLLKAVKESDLLLVVGARLGETTTQGYTLIDLPRPSQTLVHVYPDAAELNRVFEADIPIAADMKSFAEALAALREIPGNERWRPRLEDARQAQLDFTVPVDAPGRINLSEIISWLDRHLPEDTIFCNGAGNYAGWGHRFFRYKTYRSQLAPTSGSMGYGTPAAVAAKIASPDRMVVALAGDGCFMMHGQELATAVQHDAPILLLIFDNGMYGTIRMHQEREYPARISGTPLHNPDFAALGAAYGCYAKRVEDTDSFYPAFEEAMEAVRGGQSAVLHLLTEPEAITPVATLAQIREKALSSRPNGGGSNGDS